MRSVFDLRAPTTDREGHVARLCLDVEFRKELRQVRVGHLVEDDEAGVERERAAVDIVMDSVSVTTESASLVEKVDLVSAIQ